VICVKNLGAFFAGGSQREADSAAILLDDAVYLAGNTEIFGGPLHMPKELVDFILNWEIESYRQKVNA
jgi:hypothetical protein